MAHKNHVHWTQEEIEALCKKWAHDYVYIGTRMTEKGLQKTALIEGHGYRTRDLTKLAASVFMVKYLRIANYQVTLAKAAWGAVPEPAAPATPPAPEPELPLDVVVKNLLTAALKEQEERLTNRFLELLKGIPGYNRPIILKPSETLPAAPKVKRYQVVIVNAMPDQIHSVERAFPDLDIRPVDGRMPAEKDPDLVISMIKFIQKPLDKALRKHYGPRYHPVNGASDSIKFAIRQRLCLQENAKHAQH